MKIDDELRELKDLIPSVESDLTRKTFQKINDHQQNLKPLNALHMRLVFTSFLLFCLLIFSILITEKKYDRIYEGTEKYESLFSSDLAGGYGYVPSEPIPIYKSFENNNLSLFLFEISEESDELICGYIKKDVVDFFDEFNVIYQFKGLYGYETYRDATYGYYLEVHNRLLNLFYTTGKNYRTETSEDGSVTKTISINPDNVRWYKFNNSSEVKQQIDGYLLDYVIASRNIVIKEDLISEKEINYHDKIFYSKLYTFDNNKLIEKIPNNTRGAEIFWNSTMSECKGEYIYVALDSNFKIMANSIHPHSLFEYHYKVFPIKEINNKKYFSFKTIARFPRDFVSFDEERMFGDYFQYFTEFKKQIETDDYYAFYDYNLTISFIKKINMENKGIK